MRPEKLLDAIGMAKDEYIEEAAPEEERVRPETPRRRKGWMRYGSVAAAAVLLVAVMGVTQLGGKRDGAVPDQADSGSQMSSEVAESDVSEAAETGNDGSWYSAPGAVSDAHNPMVEIDSEIMAREDGISVTLPEGAEEALWFRYNMDPRIDEVRFVYGGRNVSFRAQPVDQTIGSPQDIESFTGLFYDWSGGVQSVADNDRGGFYTAVDASEGAAVLYWYSPEGDYIFSLAVSGETLGEPEDCLDSLTKIYNEMEIEVRAK